MIVSYMCLGHVSNIVKGLRPGFIVRKNKNKKRTLVLFLFLRAINIGEFSTKQKHHFCKISREQKLHSTFVPAANHTNPNFKIKVA